MKLSSSAFAYDVYPNKVLFFLFIIALAQREYVVPCVEALAKIVIEKKIVIENLENYG
jgi:hypothetical protein